MKTPKNVLCFFMMAMAIVMISCSAEDGTDGTNGIDGIDGTDGDPGPAGETGTANVIYSEWQQVDFTLDSGGSSYNADMSAPELSQEILDQGHVEIYLRMQFGPDDYRYLSIKEESRVTYIYLSLGTIHMSGTIDFSDSDTFMFRYVIIPGGTAAGTARTEGVDFNNYKEVAKAFDIPW